MSEAQNTQENLEAIGEAESKPIESLETESSTESEVSPSEDSNTESSTDSSEETESIPASELAPPESSLDELTQEEKESLPTLEAQEPQITTDTSKVEDLEEFKNKLEQAIADNESVLANTHWSLQGIAEILAVAKDTYSFYLYQVENLKVNNEQFNELRASLQASTTFINNALTQCASVHKTALRLYSECESSLDEAQALASQITNDIADVKNTLALIQEIQGKMSDIQTLRNELAALVASSESFIEEVKTLSENISNEIRALLLSDKEKYEGELAAKKDEYLAIFDEKLTALNEKVQDFDTKWIEREGKCNETIKSIEAFLSDLETKKTELKLAHEEALAEIESKKEESKSEIDSFKDEKKQEIESLTSEQKQLIENYKDEKITEIQTFKDEKKQELQTFKDEKYSELLSAKSNHLSELKLTKDEYLTEINAVSATQVMEIRELFYQIQLNSQQLGNSYKSATYQASEVFNKIAGVSDYFVFVRGGTGHSSSETAGGVTSFGEYLSANGGAGNTAGAGQRGESKGAFIRLEEGVEKVEMTISDGGIIIISWAGSMEAELDYTIFKDEDLKILGAEVGEDSQVKKDEWISQNITTTAKYYYYKNMVEMQVDLGQIQEGDLKYIKSSTFESLRALELHIAKEYLDSVTSLSDLVEFYANEIATNKQKEQEEQEKAEQETPSEPETEPSEETEGEGESSDTESEVSEGEDSSTESSENTESNDQQADESQENDEGGGELEALLQKYVELGAEEEAARTYLTYAFESGGREKDYAYEMPDIIKSARELISDEDMQAFEQKHIDNLLAVIEKNTPPEEIEVAKSFMGLGAREYFRYMVYTQIQYYLSQGTYSDESQAKAAAIEAIKGAYENPPA